MRKALEFVYDANPEGGKIIFLGDYIDRGPDNYGVLKTVMNPPENWEFITLLGNHEEMFIDAYIGRHEFFHMPTARDIAGFPRDELSAPYQAVWGGIDPSVIEWMQKLKLFHIEDKNVFAHTYYDDMVQPENQNRHTSCWLRISDFERYDNTYQGFYLTHGLPSRPDGPVKAPNRLNLDAGLFITTDL